MTEIISEPAVRPTPGLLARTVTALQNGGRLVATNWEMHTFDVLPETDNEPAVFGIATPSTGAVVFYHSWPADIPAKRHGAMMEFTTRANTELRTSAFEFDLDNGGLLVRCGLEFSATATVLTREAETEMLINAVDEVERVVSLYRPAVAAVASGSKDAVMALAMVWERTAGR